MIAAIVVLAATCATLAGGLVASLAWYRSAVADARRCERDQRELLRRLDGHEVTISTLTAERDHERAIRGAVEKQRNDAQARCREYLTRNLQGASNDAVSRAVADVFGPALLVLPQADSGAAAAATRDDPDALIDPSMPAP